MSECSPTPNQILNSRNKKYYFPLKQTVLEIKLQIAKNILIKSKEHFENLVQKNNFYRRNQGS